jgi:SHS2 domain-containing protein
MAFEYRKHTADIQIVSSAETLEEAFSEAAKAFTGILTDDVIQEKSVQSLEVSAESKEALFFEFLDELVFLLDTEGFVASRIDADILDLGSQWAINGVIHGDNISDYDHHGDVKAPTYHQLSVTNKDGVWTCSAVLDL